jgi:porin
MTTLRLPRLLFCTLPFLTAGCTIDRNASNASDLSITSVSYANSANTITPLPATPQALPNLSSISPPFESPQREAALASPAEQPAPSSAVRRLPDQSWLDRDLRLTRFDEQDPASAITASAGPPSTAPAGSIFTSSLPDGSSTAPSPAAPVNSAAASAGERLNGGLGGPSEGLQTGPTGSAVSGNPASVNILAGTGRLGELLGVNRNGIRFGGFTITDANGNVSGGLGPGKWAGDTMTVADLSIDMETMAGWKGGLFGTQFLYYNGFGPGYTINGFEQGKNNANALTGSVMPFNSLGAQPPFSRAELFQLWYRQELFDKKLVLRIGKVVPPYAFGNVVTSIPIEGQQTGPTAISSALFTPLYQNPTTLGVMPGDYNSVCGLIASYIPNRYVYLQYGFFDGNLARGVQTGLTGPHFNGYWLHLIEGGASWTVGSDRKPGKFGAGAWFQTGKLTGFGGEQLTGANGIYMFGSQRLYYENADLNGNGLTAWSQFGATNSDIVPTHRYFGFGLTYFGPVRGRDEDSCGFGLAYGIMTNNPDAGAAYFMGDDLRSNKLGSSETILTWYYQMKLGDGIFLQPNLSYIPDPAEHPGIPSAFVVTIRGIVLF